MRPDRDVATTHVGRKPVAPLPEESEMGAAFLEALARRVAKRPSGIITLPTGIVERRRARAGNPRDRAHPAGGRSPMMRCPCCDGSGEIELASPVPLTPMEFRVWDAVRRSVHTP